jgi:hypothetical protein
MGLPWGGTEDISWSALTQQLQEMAEEAVGGNTPACRKWRSQKQAPEQARIPITQIGLDSGLRAPLHDSWVVQDVQQEEEVGVKAPVW